MAELFDNFGEELKEGMYIFKRGDWDLFEDKVWRIVKIDPVERKVYLENPRDGEERVETFDEIEDNYRMTYPDAELKPIDIGDIVVEVDDPEEKRYIVMSIDANGKINIADEETESEEKEIDPRKVKVVE